MQLVTVFADSRQILWLWAEHKGDHIWSVVYGAELVTEKKVELVQT